MPKHIPEDAKLTGMKYGYPVVENSYGDQLMVAFSDNDKGSYQIVELGRNQKLDPMPKAGKLLNLIQKIPGARDAIKKYMPDEAAARRIAKDIVDNEMEIKFKDFKGKDFHNNEPDAWRHARWNERMLKEINLPTAVLAGYGHEKDNLVTHFENWMKGKAVDWGNVFNEMLMDLHNNRQGRSGKSADALLKDGDLRIIKPDYQRGKGGLY